MKRSELPENIKPLKALVRKPKLVKLGPIDPGMREGRGFSIGELKEAGLTLERAKRLGLRIDKRRRSVHSWNVKVLKELVKS